MSGATVDVTGDATASAVSGQDDTVSGSEVGSQPWPAGVTVYRPGSTTTDQLLPSSAVDSVLVVKPQNNSELGLVGLATTTTNVGKTLQGLAAAEVLIAKGAPKIAAPVSATLVAGAAIEAAIGKLIEYSAVLFHDPPGTNLNVVAVPHAPRTPSVPGGKVVHRYLRQNWSSTRSRRRCTRRSTAR